VTKHSRFFFKFDFAWIAALAGSLAMTGKYFRLMRFDRPIPLLLLLWPTLWALWIASRGYPSWKLILIFLLGTILMRSAGCIINDYADRHIDGKVKRTQLRPLAQGSVSPHSALVLFFILCGAALGLVFFLNSFSRYLAVIGFLLTVLYPFTKRYFAAPQLVLGFTYSWGIMIAFAAVLNHLPHIAWQLYGATLLWVILYDTEYALADRVDDLKIPIYSTAILFGKYDRLIIGILQITFLGWMFGIGGQLGFGRVYTGGLILVAVLFCYQQQLIARREPPLCIKAFLNNHWVGAVIFAGILLESI
jgi:4-hydroxybenzoate polyprenyltransferase